MCFRQHKGNVTNKSIKVSGFTLIELLVVLVLLGLISGIALTTVGGGNQARELKNEVNRLHAVLRIAAEEAIFSNEEIGVVVEDDHYEFLVYDWEKKVWMSSEKHALRSYTLPEWVSLDFQREGKKREILGSQKQENYVTDSEFAGGSELSSVDLFEGSGAKSNKKPNFMLLSSGEITGFIIGMQIKDDHDSRLEIKTNERGEIILPSQQRDEF